MATTSGTSQDAPHSRYLEHIIGDLEKALLLEKDAAKVRASIDVLLEGTKPGGDRGPTSSEMRPSLVGDGSITSRTAEVHELCWKLAFTIDEIVKKADTLKNGCIARVVCFCQENEAHPDLKLKRVRKALDRLEKYLREAAAE